MSVWKDYYEILGVSPDASQEEIKKAYKDNVFIYHPDRMTEVPDSASQRAEEKMKEINQAYAVLRDKQKRQRYYSEWLRQKGGTVSSQQQGDYTVSKPKPVVDPPVVRLTNITPNIMEFGSFIIRNEGGPYSEINVSNPKTWVELVDYASLTDSDRLPLEVRIKAEGKDWGKTYSEVIKVALDNEETQVKVELQTKPEPVKRRTYSVKWFAVLVGIVSVVLAIVMLINSLKPQKTDEPTNTKTVNQTLTDIKETGSVDEHLKTKVVTRKTEATIVESHGLEWSRTFGGSKDDWTTSVQQTTDGGYILAGWTKSYGVGGNDAWLIKTNAMGVEQWSQTFGGSYNDWVESIQQTIDGGYILAGYTNSYGTGSSDAWLIKTDAMGVEQWSQTFGGSDNDGVESIQQTIDGGYILAGHTWSYGAGGYDTWLIKTNAMGIEQWSQTFGGAKKDGANSVQQTTDGGYILAGYTNSYGTGSSDAWLIKTNAMGIEQWSQTFGGYHDDWIKSVQQTIDGGYILAGYTVSYGVGNGDAWLIKTNAMGVEQWSQTFGGSFSYDNTCSVQQTTDGGYILTGYAGFYGAGNDNAWLIKTNAMGVEQWSQTFGGSYNDWTISVQQTTDGGYILAGGTKSYGAGGKDAWLIKVRH